MPPSLLRSGLFWSGALTFVVMGVVGALYGPALPALARGGGVALSEAGIIVSLHALGGLLALLAGAAFGGVTGRLSILAAVAGAGMIAVSGPWLLTLAGALVLGAGYGLTATVYNRRFLLRMGDRGPAMVGLLNAIFGIGSIAGPLLFVAAGGSVMLVYAALALAFVALLPIADAGSAEGPAPRDGLAEPGSPADDPALRSVLRRPLVLVLGALAVGVEAAAVGLGPSALIARGLTEREAALTASVFFAFFLLGRVALFWIAPRVPALRLLSGALAVSAVCMSLAAVTLPALFLALAGAAIGMAFPSYFVAAAGRYGTAERVASLVLASVYVGAVCVPALAALAMGAAGGDVLFSVLAVVSALAAVLTLAAMPRRAVQAG